MDPLSPPHRVLAKTILRFGLLLTTKITDAVLLQPLSVTVTVYVVVIKGVTLIGFAFPPGGVLQEYPTPPFAVNSDVSPLQMVKSPEIDAIGVGVTTTETEVVLVQPLFVTVTV